jgi:hypothetical protein
MVEFGTTLGRDEVVPALALEDVGAFRDVIALG